jgi:hypothetical protein
MLIRWCCLVVCLITPALGQAADFFRIGSFNIEHLGSRTPAQRPIAIAEHIDLSGAVVIALQEMYVTASQNDDPRTDYDESRRNEVLDTAFSILNQEGDVDWQYELFPNRNPNDESQLCGIAWDAKRVTRRGQAFAIPITGPNASRIWDRRPHAVKFGYGDDKTDIVLIPVHMKANVPSADEGRRQRRREAEALASQLDSVRDHFDGEDDIVILGDTNFLSANEPAARIFDDAGLRDTNSLDVPTYIGSGTGAPFDRFFVSASPEMRFARQYILQATEPDAHDDYLSDHQMVLMSFRVRNDDD